MDYGGFCQASTISWLFMEHQKENNSSAGELPRRTPAHNIRVILIEKSLKFKIWHAVKLLHFAH